MASSSELCYEHRAAICLNNTGVALLQRHCYYQAFRTLSDAVVSMNAEGNRFRRQSGAANETNACSIEERLSQAARRLAKPDSPATMDEIRPCNLEVLSDDQSPAFLRQYLSPKLPTLNPTSALLLRIESLPSEPPQRHEFELQSATILYNFGIAYRCLASVASEPKRIVGLQITAMRILHLSYSILSASCNKSLDNSEFERSILIAMLVLQNLVELSSSLCRTEDCQEYANRLNFLQLHTPCGDDQLQMRVAAGAA